NALQSMPFRVKDPGRLLDELGVANGAASCFLVVLFQLHGEAEEIGYPAVTVALGRGRLSQQTHELIRYPEHRRRDDDRLVALGQDLLDQFCNAADTAGIANRCSSKLDREQHRVLHPSL